MYILTGASVKSVSYKSPSVITVQESSRITACHRRRLDNEMKRFLLRVIYNLNSVRWIPNLNLSHELESYAHKSVCGTHGKLLSCWNTSLWKTKYKKTDRQQLHSLVNLDCRVDLSYKGTRTQVANSSWDKWDSINNTNKQTKKFEIHHLKKSSVEMVKIKSMAHSQLLSVTKENCRIFSSHDNSAKT